MLFPNGAFCGGRGGKGLLTYDKSKFKKTGPLVGAIVVDDDDEVLLINSEGTIIRIKASEVSKLGRATQGVKIMRTDEDTNIISIAKVINEEEHAEDAHERCSHGKRSARRSPGARWRTRAGMIPQESLR